MYRHKYVFASNLIKSNFEAYFYFNVRLSKDLSKLKNLGVA